MSSIKTTASTNSEAIDTIPDEYAEDDLKYIVEITSTSTTQHKAQVKMYIGQLSTRQD